MKKMGIKDLKLKWFHGTCHGQPVYVSNEKILMSSNFFMKICDLSNSYLNHHFELPFKVGCCCSLPELGLIAVSERKPGGIIHIFNYHDMSTVSSLQQNNNESYSALEFVGLECLISLQIRKSYEIDLWKWHSGDRIHFLSIPLLPWEVPNVTLLHNPILWHQCLFQSNLRLILLEVKYADGSYILQDSKYSVYNDKEDGKMLAISTDEKISQSEAFDPVMEAVGIQCACWLSECNILIATPNEILKMDHKNSSLYSLAENTTGVSAMVLAKSGLFVGYKSGNIGIVNLAGNRWRVEETIKMDQSINKLIMSPENDILTVTTLNGSIFYSEIPIKCFDFRCLYRSEFVAEVAVAFIGPLANVCITATKNGFINIFRSFDGSIVCTFKLQEEITSLASSPLCSCVVIGTNCGILYFIDVTNCEKPRIVHCEKPYDTAVDHLTFDNFGRYIFASAQNQPIKIWDGRPSSGFEQLGTKKIANQVKGMCSFSRSENDDTILLILSKCGSCTDEEAGNMLIRLKLPLDFSSNSNMYKTDAFGTVSDAMLSFQTRKLNNLSTMINVHWALGAVVFCPSVQKVRKYAVWSDFENVQHDQILSTKNVKCMRLSPNQDWLALTDIRGTVQIYSTGDFGVSATSCSCDSICDSFIDFPLSSDSLIFGTKNGVTVYLDWTDDSYVLRSAPEWVVYCYSNFHLENECLVSNFEKERLDVISQVTEKCYRELLHLNEIYEELLMKMRILNFKFHFLFEDCDLVVKRGSKNLQFTHDLLEKVASHNREILAAIVPDNSLEVHKSFKEFSADEDRSSNDLDFGIPKYSTESIENDEIKIQQFSSLRDKRPEKKLCESVTFSKNVKMKSKEARFGSIQEIFRKICNLKKEFNEDFDIFSETIPSVIEKDDDNYSENAQLSNSPPPVAKRDFWRTWETTSETDCTLESMESINAEKGNTTYGKHFEDSAMKERTTSTESRHASAQDTEKQFDSDCKLLFLKRRFCDHKAYKLEVKIHCILLFTQEEEIFLEWKQNVQKEVNLNEEFLNDITELAEKVSRIQKSLQEAWLQLQKVERNISAKIDGQCKKWTTANEIVAIKEYLSLIPQDANCHNSFWTACPEIDINVLESTGNKVSFPNDDVKEGYKADCDNVCRLQIKVSMIGIVLKNLQTQLLAVSDIKHSLADNASELFANRKILNNALNYSFKSVSNCFIIFHNLLGNQLLNNHVELERESNMSLEFSNLGISTEPDKKVWRNIESETAKIMRIEQLLSEIELMFVDNNKLKYKMILQSKNLQNEFLDTMEKLENKMKESEQNMRKAKSVVDKILSQSL